MIVIYPVENVEDDERHGVGPPGVAVQPMRRPSVPTTPLLWLGIHAATRLSEIFGIHLFLGLKFNIVVILDLRCLLQIIETNY